MMLHTNRMKALSLWILLTFWCDAVAGQVVPPSSFGADDETGAANMLSPDAVRRAAAKVRTGQVYALGMPVGPETPTSSYRSYSVTVVQPGGGDGRGHGSNKLTVNDDVVVAWQGIGTKISGFAHAGVDNVYYNGRVAADVVRHNGLVRYGMDRVPPLVGRGLLLDMVALNGGKPLAAGAAIDAEMIGRALARQSLAVVRGDIVLLHTGWLPPKGGGLPSAPGLGMSGARFLADKGVVAVGSDTEAVEVVPAETPGEIVPVHQELLARRGVYMLHRVVTAELARDGAHEFLFVLGQPRLKGAVQAIINPVAIR